MVTIGLERFLDGYAGGLKNARIGILSNQASMTSNGKNITLACSEKGMNIAALFAPEHGAAGDIEAGVSVGDTRDAVLGVPVFSLYGSNRSPSDDSLDMIDVMVIDLADVGARYYTYIHTMARVIKACARKSKAVWVLDRPNPISGFVPEGYLCESRDQSFFSSYPIPITHQLTIGELAKLYVEHYGVGCDLRVVEMEGWMRGMWFDETGLRWVKPSPNMPSFEIALVYPGTCLLEGVNISEGRGTDRPFEVLGAPWIDSFALKAKLESYELGGVEFSQYIIIPNASKYQGQEFGGIELKITDRRSFMPVSTGIAIICAVCELYPDKLDFLGEGEFFDHLAGTKTVRKEILSGAEPKDIAVGWRTDTLDFEAIIDSSGALLY